MVKKLKVDAIKCKTYRLGGLCIRRQDGETFVKSVQAEIGVESVKGKDTEAEDTEESDIDDQTKSLIGIK